MELLGKVYDGSEHEVGDGYHLCKILAADIETTKVIPLYCEAYSYAAGTEGLFISTILPEARRHGLSFV